MLHASVADANLGQTWERQRRSASILAAERRKKLARGVSPWKTALIDFKAPEGRHPHAASVLSPLRGCDGIGPCYQGLTPLATDCRPFGTEERSARVGGNWKTVKCQSSYLPAAKPFDASNRQLKIDGALGPAPSRHGPQAR